MVGFSIEPTRENSLAELLQLKFGVDISNYSQETKDALNRITMPPGLVQKIPDNMIEESASCPDYAPIVP
ncbi:MAG: hypothetical protein ACYSR0_00875 [Planctomycetota bacterium]